mmetsp:Transcript_36925/g.96625  ORF Transcript_36925/g.96625 Transcript_36925/m.96625 type:complete len:99 (+) Transcript_36925:261-557(+)
MAAIPYCNNLLAVVFNVNPGPVVAGLATRSKKPGRLWTFPLPSNMGHTDASVVGTYERRAAGGRAQLCAAPISPTFWKTRCGTTKGYGGARAVERLRL